MIELVLGFILGWLLAIMYLGHAVKRAIAKINELDARDESVVATVPTLFLEEHNSILYAWDDKAAFVTQGSTVDVIIADLVERLKINKAVLVTNKELLFVANGTICARKQRQSKND